MTTRKAPLTAWKPGQSGNPAGRAPGSGEVAKLRATAPAGDRMLLLHTNMQAGHGGKSGRFARLDEIALQYAFFLDLAGIRE